MRPKVLLLVLFTIIALPVFAYDFEAGGIYYDILSGSGLKKCSVTFKSSSETVYQGAITIPQTVKYGGVTYTVAEIGRRAFEYASNLKSVSLPSTITLIGVSAFHGCTNLQSIVIPDATTSIESSAFMYCSALKSVKLPPNIKKLEASLFYGCTNLTDIELPQGITEIGSMCFESTAIQNISIPSKVTTIGGYAFSNCDHLQEIEIPGSVSKLEFGVFSNSSSIKKITLNEGLATIDNLVFCNCSSLETLNIPASVQYIIMGGATGVCYTPFVGCESLKSITVASGNQYFLSKNGVLMSKDKTQIIECPAGYVGSFAVPTTVKQITYAAFYGCSKLTSVSLPQGITQIEDYAFHGCSSLNDITLPSALVSVGHSSFWGCSSLAKLTIPNKVQSIGDYAFTGCFGLKAVYCETTGPAPICGENAFGTHFDDCVLFVDDITKYRNATGWKAFTYIKDSTNEIDMASLTIDNWSSYMILNAGESGQLTFSCKPQMATRKDVVWKTSDSSIATITQKGFLTAVGNGQYIVTLTSAQNPNVSTFAYMFSKANLVTTISFDKTVENLKVGESLLLTPSIEPGNATNKTLKWDSSDKNVAIVANGLVYAKKSGATIISCTTQDGSNLSASIIVLVAETNGIDNVANPYLKIAPIKIYSPYGKIINGLQKGLNIIRSKDGATRKVIER